VEFTPDGMLAVVAKQREETVTVLNLKSGVPQLTIDARMEVHGLRVIGNTVVVICDKKVITWNLPAGDCVSGARVGLEDSRREVDLYNLRKTLINGASISPDSRHIVISDLEKLFIYSASTGKLLKIRHNEITPSYFLTPRFSQTDAISGVLALTVKAEVWRVGGEEVLERLGLTVGIEDPPEGYPWASFCGTGLRMIGGCLAQMESDS